MIFLVDLEAVETRYTGEWKKHFPRLLQKHGHFLHLIEGPNDIPAATTPGAFLNFGGTNIYKANQVEQIGRLFCNNTVSAGDHFIFTDAWHPGIINLKYMSELLNVPVKIHALWHAGSYDPQDFLGRLIGDAPWVRYAEQSLFHAIDYNYFATQFHIDLFKQTFDVSDDKIVRTGWPMEYMSDSLNFYKGMKKQDMILFPHRIAPEKQLNIFEDLKQQLPQYEFIVCQERQLSKNEYHNLLGQAKLVFSANLQETLGISWYEGALLDAIPMVPNRLSYSEMAVKEFLYPSEWTDSFDSYTKHKDKVIEKIVEYVENHENYLVAIDKQIKRLKQEFFSCNKLLENLK